MDPVTLANLIALGLQIGMKAYEEIQQANADSIKPLADILDAANKIDDSVIAAAQAEIAKLTAVS